MAYTTTLSSAGQITLPKEARILTGITPGSKLKIGLENGKIIIERKKSLEEAVKEIDRLRELAIKKNPEILERREKYTGMTSSEMRDAWDSSPEGKAYYEEENGA